MNSNWRTVKLQEIISLKTGKLDSNAADEKGLYPFFTCSPVTLAINNYAFDTEAVLLAGNNANGVFAVKYYNGKFNAYQRTYVITPIDKSVISVRWLYFRIKHVTAELQQMSVGTATKFLTKAILDAYEVQLPPIEEQEKQAKILWDLQNKLNLNTQINQTLEQMAQAIFKSWFVDFDPVKAKIEALAAGKSQAEADQAAMAVISAKTPDELKAWKTTNPQDYAKLAQTAALFPSAMVDSELGQIPLGWEIKPFSEWVKITKGKNITKKIIVDGDVPVVAGGLKPAYFHNVHNVDGPAITISASGANAGYVNLYFENIWASDCSYISQSVTSLFFLQYVALRYNQKKIFDMQTGAAQPHIYPRDFERLMIVVSNDELCRKLERILTSFFGTVGNNQQQNIKLAKLLDTLLPKLLSGELTLNEVS